LTMAFWRPPIVDAAPRKPAKRGVRRAVCRPGKPVS